jgi:hypothetical protein
MEKYKAKLGPSNGTPDESGASRTSLGYVNLGLPAHLNIDDDMNWADTSMEDRSVRDEYHAYSFGMRSKMDINLLKFWEVCDVILLLIP